MWIVAGMITAFVVGALVGGWMERRRAGQLRYNYLAGSDRIWLHGGELTGKWKRCRRADGSAVRG